MPQDDLIFSQLKRIADILERSTTPAAPPVDWGCKAFRWRRHPHGGYLESIAHTSPLRLADLQNIERQKEQIRQNTLHFVEGRPANNVLLTGSRGTGKSSLPKALLNEYHTRGLRIVEVDKEQLVDLPDIVELLRNRPEKFIIFCDDLTFTENDQSYRALKVVLDGTLHASADNVLIYATSNRRHLIPEFMKDNLDTSHLNGEVHPAENIEDKISLSDRFGLWLSFQANDQEEYLNTARHWVEKLGAVWDERTRAESLRWALTRGNRSGRSAWQFARDWAGKTTG